MRMVGSAEAMMYALLSDYFENECGSMSSRDWVRRELNRSSVKLLDGGVMAGFFYAFVLCRNWQ